MGTTTDERGRIYLPKEVRDTYGEQYRVVQLPSHVALIPIDDDPLDGLREAIGDAFEGREIEELREDAREAVAADAEAEMADRERRQKDEE